MDWTSFSIGMFFGVLVGFVLVAMLQFIRERRDDGDDFVDEIEALGLLEKKPRSAPSRGPGQTIDCS